MRNATTHTTLVSRILVALTLALFIGGAISEDAFAWKKQTHTTIANRTQSQKDLCDVSGGSFESTSYYGSYTNGHQLIKTKTTCTGGENPQTCTNTKDSTECTSGFVVQPKGPLDGIAVDPGQISGVDPGPAPQDPLAGSSVDESQIGGVQQSSDPAPIDPIPTGGTITVPVRVDRAVPDSKLSPIDPLP
jgi:hypothetical protein